MKMTWLGHSAFRIETGGNVLLIDPFLTGNPTFQGSIENATEGCTHIILTHGHDDHVGDTVEIAKRTGAMVFAVYELALYLNGLGVEKINPGNPGGTIADSGFDVTFTKAFHSSSTMIDGKPVYLGNPCGILLRSEGKTLYHMGDTEIFGDMALVQEFFAARYRLRADRRPLHHGRQTGCHRLQALFQVQDHHPHPLRHLPHHR